MRCANFSLPSGRIKSFNLVSTGQEGNYIIIDLELYQKLLETPYKIKNPYNVAKRVYTITDLSLFEPISAPNVDLGKDRLEEYFASHEESIKESLSNLNVEIVRVDGSVMHTKRELNQQAKVNDIQTEDIMVTQDAVDFLLFQTFSSDIMEVSGNSRTTRNGGDTMSAYFVSRIIKKGAISLEQGRSYYLQVKTQYPQLIEEIDFLLISEGREDLIVK